MCILAAVTLRCSTGVPGVGLGDGCRHRGHLPFSGADGCEGCEADVVGGPAPPEKHEPLCRVLSAVSGASFTPVCTSVGVKGGVSLSVVVVVCVQPMMVRVECLQMVGT